MIYKTPKGTRDFLPKEMELRLSVINALISTYRLYGFKAWDGPAFEYLDTLIGKSGEAIVDEIYAFKDKSGRDLALRFELTTSLARIIAENSSLKKPIKVFNVGKVWRYERPQSGRFRELLQADADIFGSNSMLCEVELLTMAAAVLKKIGVTDVVIALNNRKILEALLKAAGVNLDKKASALRSLDKILKIGEEGVKHEFEINNIPVEQFNSLMSYVCATGSNGEKLDQIEKILKDGDPGVEGVNELRQIIGLVENNLGIPVNIDFSLVRGLDYYTGPIYELRSISRPELGSISAGGRYDSLVEVMGGQSTPAVGISLGIERLVEIVRENNSSADIAITTDIFVACQDQNLIPMVLDVADQFRQANISVEFDVNNNNLSKQLAYANTIKARYAFIIFSKEEQKLKEMATQKERIADVESAIFEINRK